MGSVEELLAQLREVTDAALALADAGAHTDELHQFLVGLQAERSRLAVAAADVMTRWEASERWRADGSLSAALAMARDTHSCHRAARVEVRRARWLRRMPRTREAVLAGMLSMDHVDLFVHYAGGERFDLFLEHEAELVAQCIGLGLFDDARRALNYWAALADDELGRGEPRAMPSHIHSSRSSLSGRVTLEGELDTVDGEIVDTELRRLMREIRLADRAAGVARAAGEVRAAALVRMASRSVNAEGVSARPLFQVIVGDDTARRLCELASGHVVRPGQLAPHVDHAVMEAFLFDNDGTVLTVSKRRTFTGALRRAIQVRDRRCRHAAVCPVPAVDGDVDHITPAARGGPTSQFNGRALCPTHNRHEELRDDPHPVPERDIGPRDVVTAQLRWVMASVRWPDAA